MRVAIVAAFGLLSLAMVSAAPAFFIARSSSCLDHPDGPVGPHLGPIQDRNTRIELNGTQATTYCPGRAHTIQITFPERRFALLTTTQGTLAGGTAECANRQIWSATSRPVDFSLTVLETKTVWSVPCGTDQPVIIRVTSAKGSSANFQQASLTLQPDPACVERCSSTGPSPNGTRTSLIDDFISDNPAVALPTLPNVNRTNTTASPSPTPKATLSPNSTVVPNATVITTPKASPAPSPSNATAIPGASPPNATATPGASPRLNVTNNTSLPRLNATIPTSGNSAQGIMAQALTSLLISVLLCIVWY